MNIYKVIFAKNEVIACDLITNKFVLNDDYLYHQVKGQLVYAIIKASSEEEAINKSCEIVKEVTEKVFGNDFIMGHDFMS